MSRPSASSATRLPHRVGKSAELTGYSSHLPAGTWLEGQRCPSDASAHPPVLRNGWSYRDCTSKVSQPIDVAPRGRCRHHVGRQQERIGGEILEHPCESIHLPSGQDDRNDDEVGYLHGAIGEGIGAGMSIYDDDSVPLFGPGGQAVGDESVGDIAGC